jgi:hypothetical protein
MKIPKYSYKKIRRLYEEGFSILELSLMYWTTEGKVRKVLENEIDTVLE